MFATGSLLVMSMPTRPAVLSLAARLEIDPRTAERLLVHGPDSVRVRRIREQARDAMRELGIVVPSDPPPVSERAA